MSELQKQQELRTDEPSGVQGSRCGTRTTEEALALESYKLREMPKQRDQYVHLHGEHAWDFRSVGRKAESVILQECVQGEVASG